MSLLERPYTLYVQKEADSFHFGTKFFVPAAEAAGKAGRKQQKTSLRNSSSSREVLSRLSWSFFCMRACAGERAAASLSQGGIAALPGGNVQQDVLVLSRPQHIAVSRVAHEPLSAPSRSPTSQTVMRSGSFIPYHTPNHIRQNMFKHGCLHRNSCSRHCSRGSWSTAPCGCICFAMKRRRKTWPGKTLPVTPCAAAGCTRAAAL